MPNCNDATGVDLDAYKARFVITNLKELSQEQQRMVVKMQLKGNAFFDQLVDIAETRKTLDNQYKDLFPRSDMRCVGHPRKSYLERLPLVCSANVGARGSSEIEDMSFGITRLLASDEAATAAIQAAKDAREARELELELERDEDTKQSSKEREMEQARHSRCRPASPSAEVSMQP